MTSYPKGVLQNFSPPGAPVNLGPVGEQNWRMFAGLDDAQSGLAMIQTCVSNAFMQSADFMFPQFVYPKPAWPIRVRVAEGNCTPEGGGATVLIQEFPSDILDRSVKPNPFIDSVEPGKPAALKCRQIAPDLGQLYWTTEA